MFSGPRNPVVLVCGLKIVVDGVRRQLLRMENCGDPAFLGRRLRIPPPALLKGRALRLVSAWSYELFILPEYDGLLLLVA